MSAYADYAAAARHYDETRGAVGLGLIRAALCRGGIAPADMTVLDAGCGTGNYLPSLISTVGRIEAVDISQPMLTRARAKVIGRSACHRVGFHHASILDLPFEDAHFDAVLANQVLHHLHDHADESYPSHRAALRELLRVLKPDGALIINTSSRAQCRNGFWFYHLIPAAARTIAFRFAPLPALLAMLADAGFAPERRVVPSTEVLQGAAYFNPHGPLSEAWRNGDSAWALATPAEIDRAIERILELDSAGRLEAAFLKWDAVRRRIGQTTFIVARRLECAPAGATSAMRRPHRARAAIVG